MMISALENNDLFMKPKNLPNDLLKGERPEIDMKKCELCSSVARIYCDPDQAVLCWDCDAKVHTANFLVAKHCRTLLCHTCQSPTPWAGSGSKLGPTVSVCETCVHSSKSGNNNSNDDNSDDDDDEDDDDDDDGNGDEDKDELETDTDDDDGSDGGYGDDGNDQVVPLPFTPLASGSSSSEESYGGGLPKSATGFSSQ